MRRKGFSVSSLILTCVGCVVLLTFLFVIILGMVGFYKYAGTLLPTLFSVLVALIVFGIATRTIRKRLKFELQLKRLCAKKHYLIEREKSFFQCFDFTPKGHHFIIEAPKVRFAVRYFTVKKYQTQINFHSRNMVAMHTNMNAGKNLFKALFGIKEKTIEREFSFDDRYYDKDKKAVKVILFNPVPMEINYINRDGNFTPTGSGGELYGAVIYNGSGFLNMLDKLDDQ